MVGGKGVWVLQVIEEGRVTADKDLLLQIATLMLIVAANSPYCVHTCTIYYFFIYFLFFIMSLMYVQDH